MDYLVEFLEQGGARIIKDPMLIDRKKELPNVLLNPDVRHLRGVSPSFWVRKGDEIVAEDVSVIQSKVKSDEVHSYSTPKDAPFSQTSKFIAKIEEIDAKQDEQIKSLGLQMSLYRRDISIKIRVMAVALIVYFIGISAFLWVKFS